MQTSCSGTYTVVAGDNLSTIASRCTTTVADLLALNPAITDANLIFVGQVIQVTGTASTSTSTSAAVAAPVTSRVTYTTVAGDTVASVTKRFDMNFNTLLNNNPSLQLVPGQVLTINTSTTVSGIAPGEVKMGQYLALSGDTLRNLATKFHTSVEFMQKYNPNIASADANVGGLVIILPSM
ncbi:MAG TPA: LysM peptidoglycan-binding domain-containing protein [Anaerolineaceae bacterium]